MHDGGVTEVTARLHPKALNLLVILPVSVHARPTKRMIYMQRERETNKEAVRIAHSQRESYTYSDHWKWHCVSLPVPLITSDITFAPLFRLEICSLKIGWLVDFSLAFTSFAISSESRGHNWLHLHFKINSLVFLWSPGPYSPGLPACPVLSCQKGIVSSLFYSCFLQLHVSTTFLKLLFFRPLPMSSHLLQPLFLLDHLS